MTSTDSHSDSLLTPTGRTRGTASHPAVSLGRHFGRTVSAFEAPATIIHQGLIQGASEGTESITSAKEARLRQLYHKLCQLDPNISNQLQSAQKIKEISDALQRGISAARSTDTMSLKSAVIQWLADDIQKSGVPLNLKSKVKRGFFHPVTGRQICPALLEWNDENRESLLAGTAMIYGRPVSPSDWPWHFYDPSIFSRQTPWIGTFRGPLVVNGYAHIFFTPSSAQHDDLDSRGTRSGNAEIHNMTSATGPSIAYVATMWKNESSAVIDWYNAHFFHRTSSMTASDSEPINHHLSIMAAARDAHLAASTRDSEAASAPN